jgi:16S rRNA processing protein RimM
VPLRSARRQLPVAREGYRAVGRVDRPWGLQGHIKVLPLTDFPERFEPGARVYIAGVERSVRECRWQSGRVYLRVSGVDAVEDAEGLRGRLIEVPANDRPTFDEGEYYISDIEGCVVRTVAGNELGTVAEVLTPGANDVWVVRRAGRRDVLVPAIHDVVKEIDIDARVLIVDLPEGLDPEPDD